jgi:hypothetical protein
MKQDDEPHMSYMHHDDVGVGVRVGMASKNDSGREFVLPGCQSEAVTQFEEA